MGHKFKNKIKYFKNHVDSHCGNALKLGIILEKTSEFEFATLLKTMIKIPSMVQCVHGWLHVMAQVKNPKIITPSNASTRG